MRSALTVVNARTTAIIDTYRQTGNVIDKAATHHVKKRCKKEDTTSITLHSDDVHTMTAYYVLLAYGEAIRLTEFDCDRSCRILRLVDTHKRLRPVVEIDDRMYEIELPHSIVGASYLWEKKKVREDPIKLEEIGRYFTFHTFGYYGFFKPTVEEALYHLPVPADATGDALATDAAATSASQVYYFTTDYVKVDGRMLLRGDSHHVGVTIIYRAKDAAATKDASAKDAAATKDATAIDV
jgi:hypothetical protein